MIRRLMLARRRNRGNPVPVGAVYSVRVTTSDGKVSGKSGGTFTIRR